MHYFWFIPVFAVVLFGVWLLYLAVARRLPDNSDRSVDGALAAEHDEDVAAAAKADKTA